MNKRQQQKIDSRHKILDAAARQLRSCGVNGVSIGTVMKEAGLTHGAFYAHFTNKEDLALTAFNHAIDINIPPWVSPTDDSWQQRLQRLADQYLTKQHRDQIDTGCAIAALSSEMNNTSVAFRQAYTRAVETTLLKISEDAPEQLDGAIALLAMCTGAINLARNVDNPELADRVLASCRQAVSKFSQ